MTKKELKDIFGAVASINRLKILKELASTSSTYTVLNSPKPSLYPKIDKTVIYWEEHNEQI